MKSQIAEEIEKALLYGAIVGLTLGIIITGIFWHFETFTYDREYCGFIDKCSYDEKAEWCLPYLKEASDETEYALSLLEECEAKEPETIMAEVQ